MKTNSKNNPSSQSKGEGSKLTVKTIISKIESGTGKTISFLKRKYSEKRFFFIALQHVTTTKRMLCLALKIAIADACRYKRQLEKDGHLVQSVYDTVCPDSKFLARILSTNPEEFNELTQSDSRQGDLFS